MSQVQAVLHRVQLQQAAFTAARSLYGERFAPDFNVFQFVGTSELALSNILAWTLNPLGSHGQGPRFLMALLQQFGIVWEQAECEMATVRTEVPISVGDNPRRIDILIQSQGKALLIENKPWAIDQPGQVAAYLAYADNRFPTGKCLVYLSREGRPPTPESIATNEAEARRNAGELLIASYASLVPWIERCRSVCRADRVSGFLDEFRRFIENRFMWVRDVTERDRIIEEMTRSPESVSASFQIIRQADEMKASLLRRLEGQLRSKAQPKGRTVSQRNSDRVKGSGFLIQFHENDEVSFALGFNDDQRSGLSYGVIGQLGPTDAASLHDALGRVLGPGEKWDLWPWGKVVSDQDKNLKIDSDWSATDRPWTAILAKDQPVASAIIELAEKVEGALINWRKDRTASPQLAAPASAS